MWSIWPDLHRLETGKVFSSSADAVMIPNSEELNFSGEITVSAWVKIDTTGGIKTILGHGPSGRKEVYLRLNGNSYQFGSWDSATSNHLVSANIPAEDIGEWVHLVGTYDGANWNLYRNGTLLASRADTTGALTVNANWHIGSSNGNARFFDGEIREVAIWDSALNAAQAAAVYAGTTPSADYTTVVTSYTYDAAGHILTLTDPVGNTTSYTYNYMGLVATETNEKNATRYYSYDALGRLVSKTDRNGRITTYTYDTIGRLTAENWSNTTNYFMYTYDAVGNLLYATDGQHSYSYAYDALNRPIYTTFNFDSQSAVFAYTYDLAGRQTSSSLSLNGHSDRVNQTTYDFLGNATSIRQTGSAVDEIFAEFDYNANGLMTAVRRYEEDANDVVTSIAESLYTFNANNAVTSITHKNPNGTQIVQHSYTYDSTNNIVEYLNSIDGQTTYDYDFLGQLIGADYANQNLDDEAYTYDENGNRITANGSNYTTGDNNELTSDGEYTYTYDAEGNRISKTNAANTERELYTWDYRNRLTTVTKQTYDTLTNEWTTVQIVEYAYDYNNVWIRKTLDTNGDGIADSKTIFVPENYQTTLQIDNNATTHHYLWTPNQQDKLLTDTTASGILWALTDHLETIRDVLDGNSSTHLIYDAFGNLISGTNPILFGYTGKAFDPDTALQNNINRWYDSTVGRWLSTDPMGFNGSDTNLYRYVGNRTIDSCDVMGLQIQNPFKNVKEQPRKIFENELGRIKSGIDQIQAEIEKIKNNIKKELPGYCSECDDRVQLNQIHMTSSLTATVKNKVKANKLKIINYSPKTAIVTDLAEKISSQLERGLYWTDSVDYRIQSKSYECNQSHIIKKFSGVLSRIPVTFQFSLALLNDNKTIDFYKPEYVPLIYGTPLATMDVELEFFCTIAYEIDVYHCC